MNRWSWLCPWLAVAVFPILVFMYAQLAQREEAEMHQAFGAEYASYVKATPAFFPRWH